MKCSLNPGTWVFFEGNHNSCFTGGAYRDIATETSGRAVLEREQRKRQERAGEGHGVGDRLRLKGGGGRGGGGVTQTLLPAPR